MHIDVQELKMLSLSPKKKNAFKIKILVCIVTKSFHWQNSQVNAQN